MPGWECILGVPGKEAPPVKGVPGVCGPLGDVCGVVDLDVPKIGNIE